MTLLVVEQSQTIRRRDSSLWPMLAFLRVPRGTRVDLNACALEAVVRGFLELIDVLFDVGFVFLADGIRAGPAVCSSAERLRLFAERGVSTGGSFWSVLVFFDAS